MEDQDRAFAIWLTGLPASGKSTLANLLAKSIEEQGKRVQILDSDAVRQVLTPNPQYTSEERDWFYRSLVYIGSLLIKNDVNIIIAATAHKLHYRNRARRSFQNFLEIFVSCPLEICIERDQKGIYQRALSGESQSVPGIHILYEAPESPAMIVDTEHNTPQENVQEILMHIKQSGYLKS